LFDGQNPSSCCRKNGNTRYRLVDIDETGSVCGIELLNANEQLRGSDEGRIIYVDPLSGKEAELKVA
jgi:hypothetical protein